MNPKKCIDFPYHRIENEKEEIVNSENETTEARIENLEHYRRDRRELRRRVVATCT